eukprot:3703885-Rhodomonas_salina.2
MHRPCIARPEWSGASKGGKWAIRDRLKQQARHRQVPLWHSTSIELRVAASRAVGESSYHLA